MWIWFDWQAAAVANDAGEIIDEVRWALPKEPKGVAKRLDSMTRDPLTPEARVLLERFPDAKEVTKSFTLDVDWPTPTPEGMELLDKAALILSKMQVLQAASDPDLRLEHLVKGVDELRSSQNTLEGRLVEWVGLLLPELTLDRDRMKLAAMVAKSESLEQFGNEAGAPLPSNPLPDIEWSVIQGWAKNLNALVKQASQMEDATRQMAIGYLQSTSALVGPLLAARLCTTAGSRARLARLPSSTIQVLGAEKAFFLHLRDGISPPKHGHIFQHPWVHRSPRWVRGKVSRMLAGKVSLAARVDANEGEPLGEDWVAGVEKAVACIRARHPRPPRRR